MQQPSRCRPLILPIAPEFYEARMLSSHQKAASCTTEQKGLARSEATYLASPPVELFYQVNPILRILPQSEISRSQQHIPLGTEKKG